MLISVAQQILHKLYFFNEIIYLTTTYSFTLNILLLLYFPVILLQELIPINF